MKTIKRMGVALCASLAFHTAMAADIEPQPQQVALQAAFDAASAAPAPAHSLYTPLGEQVAAKVFRNNDTVIFGEIHHSTNFKFLADNPAFFREAAANGVKTFYIELSLTWLPLNEVYFAGRIGEEDFARATLENFRGVSLTAGTSPEDYARQYLALCKLAKASGIVIRPTDFRMIESEMGTSDAFGVPDITGPNDVVRNVTFRALKIYNEKTGNAYPILADEQRAFRFLYLDLVNNLSAEERQAYEEASTTRRREWISHSHSAEELAAYQNMLQARYIARLPHEGKIAFIGGSRHFYQNNSIGDYARNNGYSRITGIELVARNGALWRRGLEDPESKASRLTGHQYQYRIRTDLGQIEDQSLQDRKPAKEKSPEF